jgi:chromosome segregation ATPase
MAEFETEVAESSPAEPSVDPSAGTQNTVQSPEDQLPFHKHPRWQERTVEIQTLRSQNAQLNARLQQLEQRREATGARVTPEEQDLQTQRAAAQKALAELAPGIDQLPRMQQLLTQQMQAQARANDTRARSHIADLAKTAGLSTDPKFLARLTRVVALEAASADNADQRYDAGDYTHLTEAFEAVKNDFPSTQQRASLTALAASKTALSKLPGRPTGGLPGGVAFTTPKAGDQASQRTSMRERHNAAGRMLDELSQG